MVRDWLEDAIMDVLDLGGKDTRVDKDWIYNQYFHWIRSDEIFEALDRLVGRGDISVHIHDGVKFYSKK